MHMHTHKSNEERNGFLVLLTFSLYILLSVLVHIAGSQAVVYCGELSPKLLDTLTHPDVPELVLVRLEGMTVGKQSSGHTPFQKEMF